MATSKSKSIVLTKEEIAEGLTPELLDSINMKERCSPAILNKDDLPLSLIPCKTGYFIMTGEGTYLKRDGKFAVASSREATVGRARYLFHHLEAEKKQEAENALNRWSHKAKVEITKIYDLIYKIEVTNNDPLIIALEDDLAYEKRRDRRIKRRQDNEKLPKLKELYDTLLKMYEEGKIVELCRIFEIEHFRQADTGQLPEPIFSAKFDDPDSMNILKNVFSASALQEADLDMNRIHARLYVETKYTQTNPKQHDRQETCLQD